MSHQVVVVGGGISGLAVTRSLLRSDAPRPGPLDILCIEASPRPGGNIRSERADGFLLEWGPTGYLDDAAETVDLARALGLGDEAVPADPAASRRFIYRKGKLHAVPESPLSALRSGLLSWGGKLRLLGEPLVRSRRGGDEETVEAFARRRLGKQAARVLVDAMVSGIFAGDAGRLSLDAAFPSLRRMEREHGSLFRAMLSAPRRASRPKLTSFLGGLDALPRALARELGPALRTGERVTGVADMGMRGLRVFLDRGAPMDVSAVVLACPAWSAASLVSRTEPALAETLAAIPWAPLAVVHLGFDEPDLPQRPAGVGFLVPRGEGPRMLGTLWPSILFPGRAPRGKALFTTMVGGVHDPEAVGLTDGRLVESVRGDLRTVMGIERKPVFARVHRYANAIPQYTIGHLDRLEAIERWRRDHPGLFFSGSSYRGVSVGSCIEEASKVAASVREYMATWGQVLT